MRIVSLLPSTTEIVCDLGLSHELFGVTVECNWPAGVRDGREIVVGTFTDPSMSPADIDAIVRQRVDAGLDLYTLDDAALARCRPDLILSQDLCRVCAVASGDVEAAVERLACAAVVLQIDPQSLHEVLESINTIACAAGVAQRGADLVASLHRRLTHVATCVAQNHASVCSCWSGSIHHSVQDIGCQTLWSQQVANQLLPDLEKICSNYMGPDRNCCTRCGARVTVRVWTRCSSNTGSSD